MDMLSNYVVLSRLQFATTTIFHIVWPVLTIGLSLFLVTVEALWLKTGDVAYYQQARFWAKLFVLNFGIGVVTGIPLEFEFGTNWAPFSAVAGNFFGNILGFEGAMAFMLEAGFLGVMLFGWRRVAPAIHLFATAMVAFGASLSAYWIMVANAWMQVPQGGRIENGTFVIDSYYRAIFNPAAWTSVGHMWFAALATSLFFIGGISAWYMRRHQHPEFFLKSFKVAIAAAILVTPVQIWLGDSAGKVVFAYQPAKGAAIEGHWQTNPPGQGAPWALLAWPDQAAQRNDWAVKIPDVLSLLATSTATGQVKGLSEFPRANQPPLLPLLFYAFRLMVAIGFAMFFLMLWSAWLWWRGELTPARIETHRNFLRAWTFAIPLGYIAVEMGWITREVGRQPWVIYGLLRTQDAASALPAGTVTGSLIVYTLVYAVLLVSFVVFAVRLFRAGPDLTEMPPPLHPATPLWTRPLERGEREVWRG